MRAGVIRTRSRPRLTRPTVTGASRSAASWTTGDARHRDVRSFRRQLLGDSDFWNHQTTEDRINTANAMQAHVRQRLRIALLHLTSDTKGCINRCLVRAHAPQGRAPHPSFGGVYIDPTELILICCRRLRSSVVSQGQLEPGRANDSDVASSSGRAATGIVAEARR